MWSESEASLIGDDALPTLTLKNTSTGPGLKVDSLVVTGVASIQGIVPSGSINSATTISSAATVGIPLTLNRSVIGSPTVALLNFVASGASVPILAFGGAALVSAVSIVFAASANWGGLAALRVKGTDGTLKWIPVLPDGVVTAAAVA